MVTFGGPVGSVFQPSCTVVSIFRVMYASLDIVHGLWDYLYHWTLRCGKVLTYLFVCRIDIGLICSLRQFSNVRSMGRKILSIKQCTRLKNFYKWRFILVLKTIYFCVFVKTKLKLQKEKKSGEI